MMLSMVKENTPFDVLEKWMLLVMDWLQVADRLVIKYK
jgi:hypothetical protein